MRASYIHPLSSFRRKSSLNRLFQILCFFIILCIYQANLYAEIRYVSKTGTSIPPYTSWATASDSIQKCIDISSFGDTIYVGNGVYKEQIIMIPGLSLIGAGMDSCVIDTREFITGTGTISVHVKDSCLFTGFYIHVAPNSNIGTGIKAEGNCIISYNHLERGLYGIFLLDTNGSIPFLYKNKLINFDHGFYVFNSNPVIRGNFISTDVFAGRGIRIESWEPHYPIVDSNYITGQTGIILIFTVGLKVLIKNNIIYTIGDICRGIFGGAVDTAWICNNLLLGNYRGINNVQYPVFNYNNLAIGNFLWGGIDVDDNNVIKNNTVIGSPSGIRVTSSNQSTIQYNNSWNNGVNYSGFTPDSTNLSVDPMVVNSDTLLGELDFHLQMFSPLIDKGDPFIFDKDSTRSDISLYGGPYGEIYKYSDLPPKIPKNLTAIVDSNQILLSWNKNTEADFKSYRLYKDTVAGFNPDSTKLISEQQDTLFLQIPPTGSYSLYYKLTAVDSQLNESLPSEELAIIISSVMDEPQIISDYILYQNYPNPFNPSTKISYKLKEPGYVKLYIYDVQGQLVETLVNGYKDKGYYEVEFSGKSSSERDQLWERIAAGIYFYNIMVYGDKNTPVFTDTKKMLLLK